MENGNGYATRGSVCSPNWAIEHARRRCGPSGVARTLSYCKRRARISNIIGRGSAAFENQPDPLFCGPPEPHTLQPPLPRSAVICHTVGDKRKQSCFQAEMVHTGIQATHIILIIIKIKISLHRVVTAIHHAASAVTTRAANGPVNLSYS